MAIRRIQFYISQLETNFNYLIKSRITANACTGLSVADPVPRTASVCQFANSTEDFAMKLVNNPPFLSKTIIKCKILLGQGSQIAYLRKHCCFSFIVTVRNTMIKSIFGIKLSFHHPLQFIFRVNQGRSSKQKLKQGPSRTPLTGLLPLPCSATLNRTQSKVKDWHCPQQTMPFHIDQQSRRYHNQANLMDTILQLKILLSRYIKLITTTIHFKHVQKYSSQKYIPNRGLNSSRQKQQLQKGMFLYPGICLSVECHCAL